MVRLGKKVSFAIQKERQGFGYAVYQCREFTRNEPVLLMLGDMVYQSGDKERNCARQLIDAFEQCGCTMVSIHKVDLHEVEHYGILHGQWENEHLMKVDVMCEKPSCDYAKEYLGVENQKKGINYYAVFGQYVLTPEVFAELENNIRYGQFSRGEIQLTDALDTVREKYGMCAFEPNGKAYDIGLPEAYRQTMWEYGKQDNLVS